MSQISLTCFQGHHVRILFGPLYGMDMLISDSQVFFFIGSYGFFDSHDDGVARNSLHQAVNTFFIPWRDNGPNIRLRLTTSPPEFGTDESAFNALPFDFSIDYLTESQSDTRRGRFNTICRSGDIAFAVKRADDEWSEDVLRFGSEPATDISVVETNHCGLERSDVRAGLRGKVVPAVQISAFVLLGVAVVALVWWLLASPMREPKVQALGALLAPAPATNHILQAGNVVYVISATQDSAQWVRQVLLKAPQGYVVRVTSLADERLRLESVLAGQAVPFVTVRMDDPANPVLVMSANATRDETQGATRALTEAMPYSRSVTVVTVELGSLDAGAQALLASAGCPYRRIARSDGATYLITGALSDESIASLRQRIQRFSHEWGTRTVEFRVQMRTNSLKGKTYQDGSDGYVLLEPASWYFPQPM